MLREVGVERRKLRQCDRYKKFCEMISLSGEQRKPSLQCPRSLPKLARCARGKRTYNIPDTRLVLEWWAKKARSTQRTRACIRWQSINSFTGFPADNH